MQTPKVILYVENGIGYGGAIICLRHLVRNLDRTRYTPVVVTGLRVSPYDEIAADAIWVPIADRRIDIAGMKRRLAAASFPRWMGGIRRILGQALARLDDLFNFLPFFVRLVWATSAHRPAIIHANNEPLCNRAALLAGAMLRVPVVCHVRGDQQGSWIMRWLFSLPDHFIPVSQWVSESIGRLGVPARKRTYIYDGIELDKLDLLADGGRFRRAHSIPEDAFVVGIVGLLIPWKGQELFLEACRRLVKGIPPLRIAIVGGTPDECRFYEAELRDMAMHADFEQRVVFTGHVSNMAEVYNGLDVVVSASTSPEPLGTMMIECMTMARPVVAPNFGGAVELVLHDETGLLFEPRSPEALAAAIDRLYDDDALGRRLGEAARKRALSMFSVAQHAQAVQRVYDQVLGEVVP